MLVAIERKLDAVVAKNLGLINTRSVRTLGLDRMRGWQNSKKSVHHEKRRISKKKIVAEQGDSGRSGRAG